MSATLAAAAIGAALLLGLAVATSKALASDGFGLDRAIAALWFHAKNGETVSLIVARWQAAGLRSGCRWCAFLNIAVERDHCAKQLDPSAPPTPLFNALRAGLCLFALAAVLWAVPLVIWHILLALVGLFIGLEIPR